MNSYIVMIPVLLGLMLIIYGVFVYKKYSYSSYVDVLYIDNKKICVIYKSDVTVKIGDAEYHIRNVDDKWQIDINGQYEDISTQKVIVAEVRKESKKINVLSIVVAFSLVLFLGLLAILIYSDDTQTSDTTIINDNKDEGKEYENSNQLVDEETQQENDEQKDIINKRYELAKTFSCGLQYVISIDNERRMHEPAASIKPAWFDFEGWNNLISISGKGEVIVGLTEDGKLYECHNDDGFNINFEDWKDIIQISTGNRFVAGLQYGGKVYVTGRQSEGQYEAENWNHITQIATSQRLIVGLDSEDTLHFAGNHAEVFEQLYKNELSVNSEKWTGIKKVYASGGFNGDELGHVAVLTEKGDLLCLGDDYSDAPGNICIENVDVASIGDYSIIAIVKENEKEIRVIGEPGTINNHESIYNWNGIVENIVDIDAGMKTCGILLKDNRIAIAGSTKNGQNSVKEWNDVYVP